MFNIEDLTLRYICSFMPWNLSELIWKSTQFIHWVSNCSSILYNKQYIWKLQQTVITEGSASASRVDNESSCSVPYDRDTSSSPADTADLFWQLTVPWITDIERPSPYIYIYVTQVHSQCQFTVPVPIQNTVAREGSHSFSCRCHPVKTDIKRLNVMNMNGTEGSYVALYKIKWYTHLLLLFSDCGSLLQQLVNRSDLGIAHYS